MARPVDLSGMEAEAADNDQEKLIPLKPDREAGIEALRERMLKQRIDCATVRRAERALTERAIGSDWLG